MGDKKLPLIYNQLYDAYGPQGWWPAKTRFEVMVGAILTQNTNWKNVETVIAELEKQKLLKPEKLDKVTLQHLAHLIRPAGYYNQKAKTLKAFLDYLKGRDFNLEKLMRRETKELRAELLRIWGVGPETADAILLYALEKPIFVVDAYTRRVFSRMGYVDEKITYEGLRGFFEQQLDKDLELFKEFHALIDELAKRHCKTTPECAGCPVSGLCRFSSKT
jgi:endonuclease-3 related protein